FRFCVVRVRRPPQPRVFPYTTLFRSTQLRPEERPLSGRRVGAPGRVPGGRRARARVGRQHARWSPCMTTACPALPASVAPGEAPPKRRLPVLSVAALLNEQQSLTAVERFAKLHE